MSVQGLSLDQLKLCDTNTPQGTQTSLNATPSASPIQIQDQSRYPMGEHKKDYRQFKRVLPIGWQLTKLNLGKQHLNLL